MEGRRTVERITRVARHDSVERDLGAYEEDEEGDGRPEDFLVEGDLVAGRSEDSRGQHG